MLQFTVTIECTDLMIEYNDFEPELSIRNLLETPPAGFQVDVNGPTRTTQTVEGVELEGDIYVVIVSAETETNTTRSLFTTVTQSYVNQIVDLMNRSRPFEIEHDTTYDFTGRTVAMHISVSWEETERFIDGDGREWFEGLADDDFGPTAPPITTNTAGLKL